MAPRTAHAGVAHGTDADAPPRREPTVGEAADARYVDTPVIEPMTRAAVAGKAASHGIGRHVGKYALM